MPSRRILIAGLCALGILTLPDRAPAQDDASAGSNPETWESAIRAYEAADRENPPEPGAVLFLGSSSIRLWKSLAEDFPNHRVLNRGFGGSQIPDSTHFVGRIVTPYRPSRIVLYAGDNDLAAGRSPDQVLADFDAFVKRVRQDLPDVPIAFISIKPSPSRAALLDRMREANGKVAQYAEEHPGVEYIDVFTPMLDEDGEIRGELFRQDRLHLNARGYELWKDVIGPQLQEGP